LFSMASSYFSLTNEQPQGGGAFPSWVSPWVPENRFLLVASFIPAVQMRTLGFPG
jgi:hypothetical protein